MHCRVYILSCHPVTEGPRPRPGASFSQPSSSSKIHFLSAPNTIMRNDNDISKLGRIGDRFDDHLCEDFITCVLGFGT